MRCRIVVLKHLKIKLVSGIEKDIIDLKRRNLRKDIVVEAVVRGEGKEDPKSRTKGEENLGSSIHPHLKHNR